MSNHPYDYDRRPSGSEQLAPGLREIISPDKTPGWCEPEPDIQRVRRVAARRRGERPSLYPWKRR